MRCIGSVVKEVRHSGGGGGLGQLMGVVRNRTRAQAQKKENCL